MATNINKFVFLILFESSFYFDACATQLALASERCATYKIIEWHRDKHRYGLKILWAVTTRFAENIFTCNACWRQKDTDKTPCNREATKNQTSQEVKKKLSTIYERFVKCDRSFASIFFLSYTHIASLHSKRI